jgi:hypothetical protein
MPETNQVSRVYSFTATMYLKFMLHAMLLSMLNGFFYYYISTFQEILVNNYLQIFVKFVKSIYFTDMQ